VKNGPCAVHFKARAIGHPIHVENHMKSRFFSREILLFFSGRKFGGVEKKSYK